MPSLPGYKAQISLTTPTSLATTNEAMGNPGADLTRYVVLNAAHRFLDPTLPVVVQTSLDGITWTPATTYILQPPGGQVVFASPQPSGTQARLQSANYFPATFLGYAKEVTLDIQMDIQEVTSFQNPPALWKQKQGTLVGASLKIAKWWLDVSFLSALGNRLGLVLMSGANPNQRYECYAFLKQDSIKAASMGILPEDLDFEVDGIVFWTPS